MIAAVRLDVRPLLVTILVAMAVVAAALVVFRSHAAVADPLDQFSAVRLHTLKLMWARATCDEHPDGYMFGDLLGQTHA